MFFKILNCIWRIDRLKPFFWLRFPMSQNKCCCLLCGSLFIKCFSFLQTPFTVRSRLYNRFYCWSWWAQRSMLTAHRWKIKWPNRILTIGTVHVCHMRTSVFFTINPLRENGRGIGMGIHAIFVLPNTNTEKKLNNKTEEKQICL